MNPAAMAAQPWARRKWWGVVLGLFAIQALLVVLFSGRGSLTQRQGASAPRLQFAGAAAADLLALTDPTLFAQGHANGFSGASWMKIPVPEYQPPEWSEPPRLLTLNARQLGSDFRRFVQTNQPFTLAFTAKPPPRLTEPETETAPPAISAPSSLLIQDQLAARRLQSAPALPPQEAADLLTNSVVQVFVNGDGNVVSGVMISSSGRPAADEQALALVRAVRFEPLPRTNAEQAYFTLTPGVLVFEWQTAPPAITNAPARP